MPHDSKDENREKAIVEMVASGCPPGEQSPDPAARAIHTNTVIKSHDGGVMQVFWIKWTCSVRASMERKKPTSVRVGKWPILPFFRPTAHPTEPAEIAVGGGECGA